MTYQDDSVKGNFYYNQNKLMAMDILITQQAVLILEKCMIQMRKIVHMELI